MAKILFVLLTVNVPLLIIDVLQQLALHFPLSVSIGVAASHAWMTVFAFSLPALTLGALTRSLVNAFMYGTVSALGFVLLLYVGSMDGGTLTASPGMSWILLWLAGIVIIDRLQVWPGSADGKPVLNEEQLNLPLRLYQRIKDEPVCVEVTYALTRLVARPTRMIKAVGGLKALPGVGSCATQIDGDGDEVNLSCLTNTSVPDCVGVVLEDPQTSRRNPELQLCRPEYGPFHRAWIRHVIDRAQVSIPFRDLSGLAHYPVDSAAIEHSRIDVTAYDPVAHFRTSVTVPSVRLVDWGPPTIESTAPTGAPPAATPD